MKTCQHPTDNHSADLFQIWYGSPYPLYLCGYHNQHNLAEVLKLIEREKNNA